eukprot:6194589-Pleurochrysis_carterae.AAC.2
MLPQPRRGAFRPAIYYARPPSPYGPGFPPEEKNAEKGMIDGKNFSLARSPAGVAIVRVWCAREQKATRLVHRGSKEKSAPNMCINGA